MLGQTEKAKHAHSTIEVVTGLSGTSALSVVGTTTEMKPAGTVVHPTPTQVCRGATGAAPHVSKKLNGTWGRKKREPSKCTRE